MFLPFCRWLGACIGYLVYTLLLLLILLVLLFPREKFPGLLVQHLTRLYPGLRWQVQSVTLQIPEGVTLTGVEGYADRDAKKPMVRVDMLTMRPDIEGMLKTMRPQARYRLQLAQGVVAGTLYMEGWNKELHFDGTVQGVQLAECAMLFQPFQRNVQGSFSASFNGIVPPSLTGFSGLEAKLRVDNGRLELRRPLLNHSFLPFSLVAATLHAHGETIQLEQGLVESELFSGQFAGDMTVQPDLAASPLTLKGTLQPSPEFFRGVSNAALLQVIRTQLKNRTLPFQISGDLYNPGIHFEEFSQLFQLLEKELK